MNDERREIQNRLRKSLNEHGYEKTTYWELSKRTDIAHGTLRNILQGRVDPKARDIAVLCRAYRLPIEYILLGEQRSIRIDDPIVRNIATVCMRREDVKEAVIKLLGAYGEDVSPISPDTRRDGTDGV